MIIKKLLKIIFAFVICLLISNITWAQDTLGISIKAQVISLNKVKLYLIGFSFEREQKIMEQSTLYFGVSIEAIVPFFPKNSGESDALRLGYSINLAPIALIGFKNYYNINRRKKLGKTIINNGASFAGFEYNLICPMLINNRYKTNYVNSFSPLWGFQKSLSKNTNLELSMGPSIQTDFVNTRISGFAKFGITFLL